MSKILFIAPIFNQHPILVHSLLLQTHEDWNLLLVHDGPNTTGLRAYLEHLEEPRIHYVEQETWQGAWGHPLRDWALQEVARTNIAGDQIVITNPDNYYVPGFAALMLAAFAEETIATYCQTVHNHRQWAVLDSQLQPSQIDGGCLVVKREAALSVGWRGREQAADWRYVQDLLTQYGAARFRKVPHVLFVHN